MIFYYFKTWHTMISCIHNTIQCVTTVCGMEVWNVPTTKTDTGDDDVTQIFCPRVSGLSGVYVHAVGMVLTG